VVAGEAAGVEREDGRETAGPDGGGDTGVVGGLAADLVFEDELFRME
jgi:hypothetical protein